MVQAGLRLGAIPEMGDFDGLAVDLDLHLLRAFRVSVSGLRRRQVFQIWEQGKCFWFGKKVRVSDLRLVFRVWLATRVESWGLRVEGCGLGSRVKGSGSRVWQWGSISTSTCSMHSTSEFSSSERELFIEKYWSESTVSSKWFCGPASRHGRCFLIWEEGKCCWFGVSSQGVFSYQSWELRVEDPGSEN